MFYFVNTYNDLQKNKIGNDYMALMRPHILKFLPKQFDIKTIQDMHDALYEKIEKEQNEKVIQREPFIHGKIDHVRNFLRELNDDLEKNDMHFSLSDDTGLDVLTITDRITKNSYEIVIQELYD